MLTVTQQFGYYLYENVLRSKVILTIPAEENFAQMECRNLIRHLVLALLVSSTISSTSGQRDFSIEDDQFIMDGKPFRIISGRFVQLPFSAQIS